MGHRWSQPQQLKGYVTEGIRILRPPGLARLLRVSPCASYLTSSDTTRIGTQTCNLIVDFLPLSTFELVSFTNTYYHSSPFMMAVIEFLLFS